MAKEQKHKAPEELNITQEKGFAEMNLEQLEDIKNSQFLNLSQGAELNDAIKEKDKTDQKRDPKAMVYQATPDDDWEREQGSPPKAEDIIEAMFNNILIYYTHKGAEWLYDQVDYRMDRHSKKRQRKLERRRALKNYSKDETHQKGKEFITKGDNDAKKAVEEAQKKTDFIEIAEKVRAGDIDGIDSKFMSKQDKDYLKGIIARGGQEELNKVFDPKAIEKAQKTYNNHMATAEVFASKMASAQMTNWKRQHLDHPNIAHKTKEELAVMHEAHKKAAFDMFNRDMNNTVTLGRNPIDRGKELLILADAAVNFETDRLSKGQYEERIGDPNRKTFLGIKRRLNQHKMRTNPYLDETKAKMEATHKEAYRQPENQHSTLYTSAIQDKKMEKLMELMKQDNATTAYRKGKVEAIRKKIRKISVKKQARDNTKSRKRANERE